MASEADEDAHGRAGPPARPAADINEAGAVELALMGDKRFYAAAARDLRAKADAYESLANGGPALVRNRLATDWSREAETMRGISEILESWTRAVPPNWPPHRFDEGLQFVAETHWPIVWVPRLDVVEPLLDADESQRTPVLLAHSSDVLDDCEAAIGSLGTQRYDDIAHFLSSAIAAARAGFSAPAQALTAGLLTTLLQQHLGYAKLAKARAALEVDPHQADFDSVRLALIAGCVPHALSQYRPEHGDPVPATFNRHAAVHSVTLVQYSEVNTLSGLILVCALLCELDDLEASGRWQPSG